MTAFLIRRLLQSLCVLLAMSALVFVGVYAIGNPVDILISPQATPEEIARTTAALGLDKPLGVQYLAFLSNALDGHLGTSFVHGIPAMQLIVQRMPATLELAVCAMSLAVGVGLPLGLWAGLRPDGPAGRSIMAVSLLGVSLPTFWLGLMLIVVFAVQLGWLPSSGRGQTSSVLGVPLGILTVDGLRHLVLPATTLALLNLAMVIRLTRAGVQEAVLQDYVRYARARGLSARRVVGVHILKNILVPVVTVVALQFGSVVAFAVVTESVFAWPGMGKLIIESIQLLDRPVIVAYLLVVGVLFTLVNLAADLCYSLLDPRVWLAEHG